MSIAEIHQVYRILVPCEDVGQFYELLGEERLQVCGVRVEPGVLDL